MIGWGWQSMECRRKYAQEGFFSSSVEDTKGQAVDQAFLLAQTFPNGAFKVDLDGRGGTGNPTLNGRS